MVCSVSCGCDMSHIYVNDLLIVVCSENSMMFPNVNKLPLGDYWHVTILCVIFLVR